jgi:transmembrane sensor
MKHPEERPLADDLAPRLDEARLTRQWGAISKALVVRPRRGFLAAALVPAGLVALALVVLLVVRPWRATSNASALAQPTDALVLADGSRVTLSRGAELVLESATRERVHLLLAAGAIDLDVTHVAGRPFVVTAGGHDVTVRGTAFSVKLDARDGGARTLTVEVTRGRVDVTGPTGLHTLDAGQSWSSDVESIAATAANAPPASASASASASAAASATPPAETIEPAATPSTPDVPAAPAPSVEGPRELLARATEARTAGRPREAAIALDTLRKRHRSDARAGLAAFELGRVRMDALHDPAGAAEAFADAIVLAPGAPFREDAEARRVEALDALPDRGRCERARDAYLARYPTGLHVRQIATLCTSR